MPRRRDGGARRESQVRRDRRWKAAEYFTEYLTECFRKAGGNEGSITHRAEIGSDCRNASSTWRRYRPVAQRSPGTSTAAIPRLGVGHGGRHFHRPSSGRSYRQGSGDIGDRRVLAFRRRAPGARSPSSIRPRQCSQTGAPPVHPKGPMPYTMLRIATTPIASSTSAVTSVSEMGNWLSPWTRPSRFMDSRSLRKPIMNAT